MLPIALIKRPHEFFVGIVKDVKIELISWFFIKNA
jgi:hypothetical protein